MDSVSLYLAKFKDLKPAGQDLKTAIRQAIKEVLGVDLTDQNLKIQGWTVFINHSAGLKSEVFLHQEQIMALVEKYLLRPGLSRLL